MMSARPLPVTATFKPKDYYTRFHPGLVYRPEDPNLSDVSAGSTDSLTSILHHESYSESGEEDEDVGLGRETWAKLRCEDDRSEELLSSPSSPSMPRWPAGGNRAITKEFLAPQKALANGELLTRNAQAAGAIYVQHSSRQRRVVASARPQRSEREPLTSRQRSARPHESDNGQPAPRQRSARRPESDSGRPAPRQRSAPPDRPSKKASERAATPDHEAPEAEAEAEAEAAESCSDRESSEDEASSRRRSTATRSLTPSRDSLDAAALSPWEKWLLNKERQLRKRQLREQRKAAAEVAEAERAAREKAEKAEREHKKVRAWIERKDRLQKRQERKRSERERAAQRAEEEKKAEIARKAKEKFEEWYSNKLSCEADAKSKQEEEEQNKAIQKEERLKKAASAYEKWLQAAKSRPPSSHFSYGFSDGKLTRYYDTSSNPPPSYVNPLPWFHPRTSTRRLKF